MKNNYRTARVIRILNEYQEVLEKKLEKGGELDYEVGYLTTSGLTHNEELRKKTQERIDEIIGVVDALNMELYGRKDKRW